MTTELPLQVVPPSLPAPAPAPLATIGGVNVEALLEKAVDAKAAVEVLERLMVMRRELQAEAAKAAFDRAMAAFQAECPVIVKSQVVHQKNSTAVRYRFAPLDVIVGQVKGLLEKHGLSHSETAIVETEWVTAVCTVKHCLGHSEKSEFKVPIDPEAYMNAAQKFASALTFAKRYAFCNAFGILTGDSDDDSASTTREQGSSQRPAANSGVSTPPPTAKSSTPTAPRTPNTVKKPIATPETRLKLIESLGDLGTIALEYFRKLTDPGVLLPNEELKDLPLWVVPTTQKQFEALKAALQAFSDGEPAKHPYPPNVEVSRKSDGNPAETKPIEVPRTERDPEPSLASIEPWYGVIVPVPRRGQKRDEYLQNPDTIGSLFDQRHGNDEESQEARKRLWGFVHNYEAKGWEKRDGTKMPPSQGDIKFREALDQFSDWFEKNHPGEKL